MRSSGDHIPPTQPRHRDAAAETSDRPANIPRIGTVPAQLAVRESRVFL